MFYSWRNEYKCTCSVQSYSGKRFLDTMLWINIWFSILTFTWSNDINIIDSPSVTGLLEIDKTSSILEEKLKLTSSNDKVIASSSLTEFHLSSSTVISVSSTTTPEELVSSSVISTFSKIDSLESTTAVVPVIPEVTTSVHHQSSISSVAEKITTSLYPADLSSKVTSLLPTVPILQSSINDTISPSTSVVSNINSGSHHLESSKISPMNSSMGIISNSTSSKIVSSSLSTQKSQGNSSVVPSPSSMGVINMTSTMHTASSWIYPSFVMSSTIVCPTTTIYINCSSDYHTISPSSPIIANLTSSFANLTSSVVNVTSHLNVSTIVNFTSTAMNFTSSVANFSSTYLTSTVMSIINSTSTSYITTILTRIPLVTSSYVYINSSISPAIISTHINVSTSSSIIYSSAQIIIPPIKKCDVFLSEFTDAHTEMSKCLLQNMHPMRVCSNCSAAYDAFSKHHKKIFKDCGEILIYDYNMQYQVIPKMFAAQEITWKSLECDKCYVKDDSGVSQFSPEFNAYIDLYVELNSCFHNHTHETWVYFPNNTIGNTTYDKEICYDCYELYHKMQVHYEYYGDGGEDSPTKWCADINVAVNETRHRWSSDFKCGKKEKDLESVIALTCFFCFLPIVFYVGAKLHADVRERKSANRYTYDSE